MSQRRRAPPRAAARRRPTPPSCPSSPRCPHDRRHHVDLLWLRIAGISQTMVRRPEFRDYVHGYDPRASFPHGITIHRLAEVVAVLQKEERTARISRMTKEFKGGACIGIQLDMWTDSTTHTAYGCVGMTSVVDPTKDEDGAQLWVRSELLDFNVFPKTSKTGENIKTWFLGVLDSNGLPHDLITGITPDGAADGQCGLSLIPTLAEKVCRARPSHPRACARPRAPRNPQPFLAHTHTHTHILCIFTCVSHLLHVHTHPAHCFRSTLASSMSCSARSLWPSASRARPPRTRSRRRCCRSTTAP